MESNPSKENISKLLNNFTEKLTDILISSIKIFSYTNPNEKIDLNVAKLLEKFEK